MIQKMQISGLFSQPIEMSNLTDEVPISLATLEVGAFFILKTYKESNDRHQNYT